MTLEASPHNSRGFEEPAESDYAYNLEKVKNIVEGIDIPPFTLELKEVEYRYFIDKTEHVPPLKTVKSVQYWS